MTTIKKIHHVAIATANIPQALSFWQDALGLTSSGEVDVPQQQSRIAFLPTGESEVELVEPTSETSGLAKHLAKRGPGLHHICLEVDDLDGMLNQLRGKGIRLIGDAPSAGADGRRMMFVHPESTGGVLVELYEENRAPA
jgi:methylmalonyl-CoA/ethylmalonyl-CoA epimerase